MKTESIDFDCAVQIGDKIKFIMLENYLQINSSEGDHQWAAVCLTKEQTDTLVEFLQQLYFNTQASDPV